ncbi:MAG: hypothetical protein WCY19_02595 [Candidatus Gastranaerophilaceae bacterium]
MKKSIMDKFLFFSFKFGKVFSSILLVVLIATIIFAGIFLLKMDRYSIETPSFDIVKAQLEAEQKNDYSYQQNDNEVSYLAIEKQNVEKKYGKLIEKIIEDNNLSPIAYDLMVSNIVTVNTKFQDKYAEGLGQFISDGISYAKDKKIKPSKDFIKALLESYQSLFNAQVERVDTLQSQQMVEKITSLSVIEIFLALFNKD